MNLLVLAHPRSGHHAFIDWYCSHCKETTIHVNDPTIKHRVLYPNGGGHIYKGAERTESSAPIGAWEPNVVVNFERPDCRELFLPWRPIVFVRSLETFLSSVTKLAEDTGKPNLPDLSVLAWDWCMSRIEWGMPYVHFDRWASSRDYRMDVAEGLGIATNGDPWHRVSPFGGTEANRGSSYDGMQFDGEAHKMRVTSRDESQSPIYQRYATPERQRLNELLKR